MTAIILIVHIVIAVALIFVIVVMQRSEGGGLGIGGGGGGGMGNFMTGRSTANFFTRTTAVLAALFMISSISLTMLENSDAQRSSDTLVDQLRQTGTPGATDETPAPAPAPESAPGTPKVE
ncbi:MAG TPA: preprotein translocase subunit SecG [Kiloniellales bacterium]|nr:preprotein translocase subunit SecG [Kiloniellales bacterium]